MIQFSSKIFIRVAADVYEASLTDMLLGAPGGIRPVAILVLLTLHPHLQYRV